MGKRVEKTVIATKRDERLNFSQTHNHLTCLKAAVAFGLLHRVCVLGEEGKGTLLKTKFNWNPRKIHVQTECFVENYYLKRKALWVSPVRSPSDTYIFQYHLALRERMTRFLQYLSRSITIHMVQIVQIWTISSKSVCIATMNVCNGGANQWQMPFV